MRIIAEQTLETEEELCVCFIDWQKAFDRVNWMLKCLSLESRACYTFGFVYSCLTALQALHDCTLWHCCSFSFLVHCIVLCLQWEHHNDTTFSRSGSYSLSLSMVSACSLWCVLLLLLLLCVYAAHSHTSAHELYPTQLCLHRTRDLSQGLW